MLQFSCTFSNEGELQLWAVRLRLNYFHMNPNRLQDSITDVCSRLGYPLVHLINYPVTTLVSFGSKVNGPFYAKPDKEKV
jgi:hypothetical protein